MLEFSIWPGRNSLRIAVNPAQVQFIASSGNAPAATRIMVGGEEFTVCGGYNEVLEKLNGADNSRNEPRDNGKSKGSRARG